MISRARLRAVDASFLNTIIENTGIVSNAATADYASDLAVAVTAMNTGADSKVFAIAPPSWVKGAAFARGSGGAPMFPNLNINGGNANGVTVIPSDSLSDTVRGC